MDPVEQARLHLYRSLDNHVSKEELLSASQKMDQAILEYMKNQIKKRPKK